MARKPPGGRRPHRAYPADNRFGLRATPRNARHKSPAEDTRGNPKEASREAPKEARREHRREALREASRETGGRKAGFSPAGENGERRPASGWRDAGRHSTDPTRRGRKPDRRRKGESGESRTEKTSANAFERRPEFAAISMQHKANIAQQFDPGNGNKDEKNQNVHPKHPGGEWIYGVHAVFAAIENTRRFCHRLLVAEGLDRELHQRLDRVLRERRQRGRPIEEEIVDRARVTAAVPSGAVHQGLALLCEPLVPPELDDLCARLSTRERALVLALDQVTDPQNFGAVLRSAAAFGCEAVITGRHHAPANGGVLAKAASGAVEKVPVLRVPNLVRAIERFKKSGFWAIGLSAHATDPLAAIDPPKRVVLVVGAEGPGLRRLTEENCDVLARIPIAGAVESLNVSNSAAIALYELARPRDRE